MDTFGDSAARGIAVIVMIMIFAGLIKLAAALIKWARRASVDSVARAAGAVTAAAERKAKRVAQSFKNGYRS